MVAAAIQLAEGHISVSRKKDSAIGARVEGPTVVKLAKHCQSKIFWSEKGDSTTGARVEGPAAIKHTRYC